MYDEFTFYRDAEYGASTLMGDNAGSNYVALLRCSHASLHATYRLSSVSG